MGVVYEAVQESLGRHVALKVLPAAGLMSPTHLERFRREARAAARLHHTNIVPVFGVGEHEGVHYFAMQFIRGQSLDRVLHELAHLRRPGPPPPGAGARRGADLSISIARGLLSGRFPDGERPTDGPDGDAPAADRGLGPARRMRAREGPGSIVLGDPSGLGDQSTLAYSRSVARVGVQVAEALAYSHQQGILHRDIKPANLLLDTQGTVWVSDFGLVKEQGTEELTTQGDFVGTLRYMAPERFLGRSDPRSDVYGLGLTLYEMLTLRPAFAASDRARLVERVQHEEPPRPRKLDPHIPRDLETIVLKAIAKEPGRRYATATAMAEDLRRFLADRPVEARRAAAWERVWRWVRRNPGLAVSTASAAVLLVVIAAGSVAWTARLGTELRRTTDARAGGAGREEGRPGQALAVAPRPGAGGPLQPAPGPAARQPRRPRGGRPDRPRGGRARGGDGRAAKRGDRLPGPARPAPRHDLRGRTARHFRDRFRPGLPALRAERREGRHQRLPVRRRPADRSPARPRPGAGDPPPQPGRPIRGRHDPPASSRSGSWTGAGRSSRSRLAAHSPSHFSGDSSRLVAVRPDGSIGMWDLRTGRETRCSADRRSPRMPSRSTRTAGSWRSATGSTRPSSRSGTPIPGRR